MTPQADRVAGIVSIIAIRPLFKSEGPLLDRPRPVKPYQTIDPAHTSRGSERWLARELPGVRRF